MFKFGEKLRSKTRSQQVFAILLLLALIAPSPSFAEKKKKEPEPTQPNILEALDLTKIVWPNPPAITRIKYLDYFCCEKPAAPSTTKKSSWMDRMAGGQTAAEKQIEKPLFSLWTPYGIAVDSKGKVYTADARVGAIFVFDPQTKAMQLIKNGQAARFGEIIGLAIDDDDRLFVSDTKYHHVLVFGPDHQHAIATLAEGMVDPGGLAIDHENRFLYVPDAGLDQVLVYDADSFKLLRKIGVAGKNHTLTGQGEFSKPTNVAVDDDGNVYVSDTLNNRIEVFDADGNFIREFGKAGDGPGRFARPKGIAIDADGHIWVADAMQDRVQCFTPEGRLLIYMGDHGMLPGQFSALAGLAIDKQNRIFTAEQYPGRVQMFRYFTNDEAKVELKKREEEQKKKDAALGRKPAAETKPGPQ